MKLYCCDKYIRQFTIDEQIVFTNITPWSQLIKLVPEVILYGTYIKSIQTSRLPYTQLFKTMNSSGKIILRPITVVPKFRATLTSYTYLFIPSTVPDFFYFVNREYASFI